MRTSDRSLVVRARAGDQLAYARLLKRHRARLAATCVSVLRDEGEAADVAQDAALVAWLQLDRLRDLDRFDAWLVGIARMLCRRALRARGRARVELAHEDALSDLAAAEGEGPQARLLAAERASELAAAIAALPPGQRDAVVLYHLGDLPQATVAERLGTAGGAVRTRLHKARAGLRARLTPVDHDPPETSVPETTETTWIPARVRDVRRTPAARHVIVLSARGAELPIWVGAAEAEALVAGLQDVELPRPSASALTLSLLRASGRHVQSVRICRLDAAIFYAEVVLDNGSAVDARPSDALALAVAHDCPIAIHASVLADAGSTPPLDEYFEDLSAAQAGAASLAAELRKQLTARAAELERLRQAP